MKVWVLVGIFANRSHSVLGVYATREEAQEDEAEFAHQANYERFMLTRHYVKDSEYFYENPELDSDSDDSDDSDDSVED